MIIFLLDEEKGYKLYPPQKKTLKDFNLVLVACRLIGLLHSFTWGPCRPQVVQYLFGMSCAVKLQGT